MLLSTAAATLAALAITATPAPSPTPTLPEPEPPVSVAQICARTSIDAVDALLASIAETELVGALAPLLDITVPSGDGVEVDAAIQLEELRSALNCDPGDDPEPTDEPDPTTTAPAPTDPAPTTAPDDDGNTGGGDNGGDDDGDDNGVGGDGSGGVSIIPDGAPETGGTPPADTEAAPLIIGGTVLLGAGAALIAALDPRSRRRRRA